MKIVYMDERGSVWLTEAFSTLDGFARATLSGEAVSWKWVPSFSEVNHIVIRVSGRVDAGCSRARFSASIRYRS